MMQGLDLNPTDTYTILSPIQNNESQSRLQLSFCGQYKTRASEPVDEIQLNDLLCDLEKES